MLLRTLLFLMSGVPLILLNWPEGKDFNNGGDRPSLDVAKLLPGKVTHTAAVNAESLSRFFNETGKNTRNLELFLRQYHAGTNQGTEGLEDEFQIALRVRQIEKKIDDLLPHGLQQEDRLREQLLAYEKERTAQRNLVTKTLAEKIAPLLQQNPITRGETVLRVLTSAVAQPDNLGQIAEAERIKCQTVLASLGNVDLGQNPRLNRLKADLVSRTHQIEQLSADLKSISGARKPEEQIQALAMFANQSPETKVRTLARRLAYSICKSELPQVRLTLAPQIMIDGKVCLRSDVEITRGGSTAKLDVRDDITGDLMVSEENYHTLYEPTDILKLKGEILGNKNSSVLQPVPASIGAIFYNRTRRILLEESAGGQPAWTESQFNYLRKQLAQFSERDISPTPEATTVRGLVLKLLEYRSVYQSETRP